MGTYQTKCSVGIMRQSKAAFSARSFNIYIDGVKATSISNGGTTKLSIASGRHIIGFGVGSKVTGQVTLELSPGDEENIMCYAKGSGVKAVLTSVDVCALAGTNQTPQAQSNNVGYLIGLILFLIGLAILGVRLKFFLFFIPIE